MSALVVRLNFEGLEVNEHEHVEHETSQVHEGRVDECGNVICSGKFHQKLKFCKESHDLIKFESSEGIKIIEGEV